MGVISSADGPTVYFTALAPLDGFGLAALGILLLFYGVYFAKMGAQRRRGIRTNRLGRQGSARGRMLERTLAATANAAAAAQLCSVFCGWNAAPAPVRAVGAALGLAGDAVFFAAVRAMRDSWRAGLPEPGQTSLVTDGVYRYSRNPAFLGFDLLYLGLSLLYCNPLLAAVSACAMVMLHLQILREERFLREAFGEAYAAYQRQTARYWGRRRG